MEKKTNISNTYKLGKILITEEEIRGRAAEIGEAISRSLNSEPVLIVGILKGAVLWMSDLIKHITAPVSIDFMVVSSYGAVTESSGSVNIKKDLDIDISGSNVIVVDDIVDSGVTFSHLRDILLARNPKSLRFCALLDKPSRRKTEIDVEYIGFTVDDLFIVGYGLDVDQQFRNLPYITYIEQKD